MRRREPRRPMDGEGPEPREDGWLGFFDPDPTRNAVTRSRGIAVAATLVVMLAACGDSTGLQVADEETSTTSPVETTSSTTGPDTTTSGATSSSTTTTTAESTTTTTEAPADPFDPEYLLTIEPVPIPELEGAAAIIGGTPEWGLAAALTAELEATGLDLTGTRIEVRPVTGTGESLLVFWIDDTATALGEDDTASDTLLATLLGSPILSQASITRFVLNFRSEDAEGPYVLTATAAVDKMLGAMENGEPFGEEDMLLQFTRLEGS